MLGSDAFEAEKGCLHETWLSARMSLLKAEASLSRHLTTTYVAH